MTKSGHKMGVQTGILMPSEATKDPDLGPQVNKPPKKGFADGPSPGPKYPKSG